MKIYSFSHIGKRDKNEDFIGNNLNAFIVCDGIGGYSNGDVASKYIVKKLLSSSENSSVEINQITRILNSLRQLYWWKFKKPKIGTTFVGLFKTKNEYFVSHIGDSRLYFIRPTEAKIWHTWDHTEVSELLKSKQISREEARTHELKLSLTKSVSTSKILVNPTITRINELKQGDILFLCTDGVYEVWLEHKLMELLCIKSISTEQKMQIIQNHCEILSTDNNSAFLLEIEKQDKISNGNNEEIEWINLVDFK